MCQLLNSLICYAAPISKDVAIAILTGIYSGLILVKYTEFRNLREESGRILQKGLTAKELARELGLISNSLSRLGHKASSKSIINISDEYRRLHAENTIFGEDGKASLPSIQDAAGVIDKYYELRNKVNALRPSWLFIFSPFM